MQRFWTLKTFSMTRGLLIRPRKRLESYSVLTRFVQTLSRRTFTCGSRYDPRTRGNFVRCLSESQSLLYGQKRGKDKKTHLITFISPCFVSYHLFLLLQIQVLFKLGLIWRPSVTLITLSHGPHK